MNTKTMIAFGSYLIAILIITSIAVIYLISPQLLTYQEQAIGVPWANLEPGFQAQFLSLMKVAGGGYLSTAIALATLLFIPFRQGERWVRWAISGIGIFAIAIVNYAGITVILNTPGRPPLIAGPIAMIFLIIGFFLANDITPLTKDDSP